MLVLMVVNVGYVHYCVKSLLTIYASLLILHFVNSTRGTEMRVTNKQRMRPKVEIKDTCLIGSPIGDGVPLELAKALHEMAKAAQALASKVEGIGSVGILVGNINLGKGN
jgi:hypothetical protein